MDGLWSNPSRSKEDTGDTCRQEANPSPQDVKYEVLEISAAHKASESIFASLHKGVVPLTLRIGGALAMPDNCSRSFLWTEPILVCALLKDFYFLFIVLFFPGRPWV